MEERLLEQGRLLKDSAGCMFYDPAALVAFCRFNFLLRRAFIRLLHADLSAVRQAVEALECERREDGGLPPRGFFRRRNNRFSFDSSAKTGGSHFRRTTPKVPSRGLSNNCWRCAPIWKKRLAGGIPQRTVALRSASRKNRDAPRGRRPRARAAVGRTACCKSRRGKRGAVHRRSWTGCVAMPQPLRQNRVQGLRSPTAEYSRAPTGAAEAEKCLEAIWEQLIAAPPSRGRRCPR